MRFFRALFYPFEDRSFLKKLGPAFLIAAIPVLSLFFMKGWEYEISSAVRRGDPAPLPDWSDLWGKFKRGFVIQLAGFFYNVPGYMVLAVSLGLWLRLFVTFFRLPERTFATFFELLTDGLPLRLVILGVGLLVSLLTSILYWSGYIRYIEYGSFSAFFEIFKNIATSVRTFVDDLLVALYILIISILGTLITFVAGLIISASGIGIILIPIIFSSITGTILTWVQGHLFGQLAARAFGPYQDPIPPTLQEARLERN